MMSLDRKDDSPLEKNNQETLKNNLAKIKQSKPVFLLGNGICQYLSAFPSWDDLLSKLDTQGCLRQYQSADDKNLLNYPEQFSLLTVDAQKQGNCGSNSAVCGLKKKVADKLKDNIKSCSLLRHAKQAQCPILTTNFEFLIEKQLGIKLNAQKCQGAFSSKKTMYRFSEYFSDSPISKNSSKENHCAVWHIQSL